MRIITVEGHTFDYDEIVDIDTTDELARPEEWNPGILLHFYDRATINLTTVGFAELKEMAEKLGPEPLIH
jgi:hypothetical protein